MVVNPYHRRTGAKQEPEVERTATTAIEEIGSVGVQLHLQTLTRQGEGGTGVETEEELRMRQEVSFGNIKSVDDFPTSQ